MEWILLIVAAAIATACASLRLMMGALSEARRLRGEVALSVDPDVETLRDALVEARADAEAWRSANQSRIAFLDRLGPELRGPLNAIAGFAELMRARSAEEPLARRQAQAVDQIIAGADRLQDIVEEAADLARLEAGRMILCLEKVDPGLIARQVCEAMRPGARAAGVSLTPPPARPGAAVIADRERLRQLMTAMIATALGRSVAGEVLKPELHEADDLMVLTLRDGGPRLTEAARSALFEPFGDGVSGGGLATASRLALAMGGELEIASPPDGGAILTLSLRMAVTAPVEDVARPTLPMATVLYVEDEASSQALMRHLVPTLGPLTLHVADTARDGLALARDLRPDVVLLNIGLRDMDGYQLMERLRDEPLTASIPVLAVSSRPSAEETRRGRKAGFAALLVKPLHVPTLASALSDVLSDGRSEPRRGAGRNASAPSGDKAYFHPAG